MKKLKISPGSRGDTIIEVLLSITILGLVLTGAYALANRNLSSGISAGRRDQALASAQTQVEHIINAQKAGDTALEKFTTFSGDFCILAEGEPKSKDNDECRNYDSQQYALMVHYANNVFTVTAQWTPAGAASYQDQLKLYYRLPGTYTGPGPGPSCSPETVNMPKTGTGELWWGGLTIHQIDLPKPLVAFCDPSDSDSSSTYELTVTPFDESHCGVPPLPDCVSPNIKRPEQINERVFIEGLSGDGSLIFRTPPTDDIPLNQTEVTNTFRVSVTRQVDYLLVKHCSIHPDIPIYQPCRANANSVHGTTITITPVP
ncbi:hypothetical protein HYS84_02615 [Candidatus Saccharibacteria bacterium]|nr:hypothetical protein [Candidatus Saccharibacteria bacterium]